MVTKQSTISTLLELYSDADTKRIADPEGGAYYCIDAEAFDEFVEAHGGKVKSADEIVDLEDDEDEDAEDDDADEEESE